MSDLTVGMVSNQLDQTIHTRMEYIDYLRNLMVHSNGRISAQSFVQFSGVNSDDPRDTQATHGQWLDQTELLMLIEFQSDRVSQSMKLKQALGGLKRTALGGGE